jgi:hypothetical protein
MVSNSSGIEAEIMNKAKEASFGSISKDRIFSVLMEMKIKVDMLNKGNQRQGKDLAILYCRFIHNSNEHAIPYLH